MRTFVIAALIFFSLAPTALAVVTTPAVLGGYCANNAGCQSGNCDTSSWFSFNYKCVPATQTPSSGCTSNSTYGVTSCTLSGGGSGVCSFDSFGTPICAVNPAGTGGIQPSGGGNVLAPTQPSGGGNVTNVTLINPLKSGTSLTSFLNNILDFVIYVGSIIVILMLVFVGFKFVVAQGKDAALVEARKMLLWTIIGALVLLGAKAISAGILATVQSLGG